MRRILKVSVGVVLVLGMLGCSAGGPHAPDPCERCSYSYGYVKKVPMRNSWCIIDGKTVDCSRNPSECPECAKRLQ